MEKFNNIHSGEFLNKKIKRSKILDKNEEKESEINGIFLKDQTFFDSSTDISTDLNEKLNRSTYNYPIDSIINEIYIPSFLNDITKYNNINKKIKNYHKIKKCFKEQESANLYLVDINRLYEIRNKIKHMP